MNRLFLFVLTAASLLQVPAFAASCSGGAHCTACSNCSRCGHCSAGGTCSVCHPELYESASLETPSSVYSPSRARSIFRPPPQPTLPDPVYNPRTRRWEVNGQPIYAGREEPPRAHTPLPTPIPLVREMLRRAYPTPTTVAVAFSGRCVAVTDGDTVQILVGRRTVKVRLNGIDCPEKAQPWGQQAKTATSEMAFGKTVKVYPTGTDRYSRTLGWLFVGNTAVNRELVAKGLAWWYREYSPNEVKLRDLEASARASKLGLWSDAAPIAPWEWRRGKRSASPSPVVPKPTDASSPEPTQVAPSRSWMDGPLWWAVPASVIALLVAPLAAKLLRRPRP